LITGRAALLPARTPGVSALAAEIAAAATARKRRRDALESSSAGGARPESVGRAAKLPTGMLGRWAAVAEAERAAQEAEEAAAAAGGADPFPERTAAARAWRAQLDATDKSGTQRK
jgi:hypothetical protein